MKVVVDPGVLVAAAISDLGAPRQLVRLWDAGTFELVASPMLFDELERALRHPHVERRVARQHARRLIVALRAGAIHVPDPDDPPPVTRDRKDYLVALACAAKADLIVSGDRDLLEAGVRPPVLTPRELVQLLEASKGVQPS